ncbi:MAG: bifunctional hydroxymethylpyrimidine kinase/phosphomethylpyrimidine kinase [Acidobacteriia bacterium]|nr:bifunctional hydroxymethylpyrimidine kinase/phosphomethylpyrimidine kinase [Terriglobia bacterium]
MRRAFIRLVILSLALLSLFISLAVFPRAQDGRSYSAPRLDAWRILGPGGGGAQFHPAVSPHDTNLVLVACDMTGAYISENGGASWRLFDLRSPVRFFAFDPLNSQVIYAAAHVLWRSADRGHTWSLVYPPPDSVTRLIMPDDHASPVVLTAQGRSGAVTALAVDPADSKKLYAVIGEAGSSALYLSNDWGAHWQRAASLPEGAGKIYIDPRSPATDRTLYVLGGNSVSIRKAGVWQQGAAPAGVMQSIDSSGGFSSAGQLTVYMLAGGRRSSGPTRGVFLSHDGGVSWSTANDAFLRSASEGAPLPELTSVGTCFDHPEVAYVSYEGLRLGGEVFHGVAKTRDAGATWELVWKEAQAPASNVRESWISERFGTGWGEPGISLGVAPNNPDICYRTDDGRTMRTLDGGKTWDAVYSHRLPDGTYTTTGLDVTTNYGIFFDPFDPRRVFIAYTDIGLFRSENDGQSWTSSTEGVPRRWVNTTYWITFDPAVKGRVWGVMSYVHDLPRPKMWRRTSPERYDGGVCISDDGGKTWRPSNQGMPATAATHIVLDPVLRSSSGAELLEAGGVRRLVEGLLPLCTVITPNAAEAEVLAGIPVRDLTAMGEAARALHRMGVPGVVVTAGHLDPPTDLLSHFDGERVRQIEFPGTHIVSGSTHGTGCAFATALAANLALGYPLAEAVGKAKKYVAGAIAAAPGVGRGIGPLEHLWNLRKPR